MLGSALIEGANTQRFSLAERQSHGNLLVDLIESVEGRGNALRSQRVCMRQIIMVVDKSA